MQEKPKISPMCSIDHPSFIPTTIGNHPVDSQLSSNFNLHEVETQNESTSSTPELNLLLDKLTEILRFRSGCRRSVPSNQQQSQGPSSIYSNNLKRLQSGSIEPLNNNNTDASNPMTSNGSSASIGAWKSSNNHHKTSITNRVSHHHHQHHSTNLSVHVHNLEKKRRLPSLLQRLLDEGNLIKEAVRRLKSQRFSHAFKQQTNILNTPSTPTIKSSGSSQYNFTASASTSSMALSQSCQLSDSPTQTTASPNRGISWFLSSSVFGVNASATNQSSGSGSPLRTCYSSSAHDRTPMEIGIHDG